MWYDVFKIVGEIGNAPSQPRCHTEYGMWREAYLICGDSRGRFLIAGFSHEY